MLGHRRRTVVLRSNDGRGSVSIDIHEQPSSGPYSSGTVWDCGEIAAEFFWESTTDFGGIHLLELGSGTGLAGIAAACAGAQVRLTDLQGALPLIRENVEANEALIAQRGGSVCEVLELDLNQTTDDSSAGEQPWCSKGLLDSVDVILLADVTYHADLVQGAVRTAHRIILNSKTSTAAAAAAAPAAAAATTKTKSKSTTTTTTAEPPAPAPVTEVLVVHRPRGKVSNESIVEAFREGGFSLRRCAATPWPDAHYFVFTLDSNNSGLGGSGRSTFGYDRSHDENDAVESAKSSRKAETAGSVIMAALATMADGEIKIASGSK